ncbi:hypothetical protein PIB30_062587 [Stylosanthes scabra]|uniref:PB1-like domain-containing protein n=1 Tax=Stylosanthes scabra TaxID=79078 RepID=A0ABU6UK04_9FABA|nr:hypothetical protein [Stylosanthes scabra]
MALMDIALFHKGYFGYVDGRMRYLDGMETYIQGQDSDFWAVFEAEEQLRHFSYEMEDLAALWYKSPAENVLEIALHQFLDDGDALEMVRIARMHGHVELYVVHDEVDEGFPEAAYIDVGGIS